MQFIKYRQNEIVKKQIEKSINVGKNINIAREVRLPVLSFTFKIIIAQVIRSAGRKVSYIIVKTFATQKRNEKNEEYSIRIHLTGCFLVVLAWKAKLNSDHNNFKLPVRESKLNRKS